MTSNEHATPPGDAEADGTDPAYRIELKDQYRRQRASEEARRMLNREARPHGMREWTAASDFIAAGPVHVPMRIDGLLPRGGFALLAAQAKAGKTTLLLNTTRCLLTGHPVMGRFPVEPVTGRIAILDYELSPNVLRDWLTRHDLNTDRLVVLPLRGQAYLASELLDPRERAGLAAELRNLDVEVLIVDPLSALLQAAGIEENSNSEVGRLLRTGLQGLVSEAGVSELIVAHHMGNLERSRGATVINDTPDALWRLVIDGPSDDDDDQDDDERQRYFSAYGRDVYVPQGRVDYDYTNGTLTMPDGAPSRARNRKQQRAELTASERREKVLNALYKAGGVIDGRRQLQAATGLNNANLTAAVDDLELRDLIEVEPIKDGRSRLQRYRRRGDNL